MGELYEPFPKLPKNIRQIGERDQVLKLYLEDYVNTFLKRLQPAKGADLRVGLLLGSRETHEDMPYVFVDGALEMDAVAQEGEKVVFTEDAWKKAYQDVEQMFPKRTVQGWFLCAGPGCTLSPLNYWRQHNQYFTGKNQLMYLNYGLEGDESVYIASADGFYKLCGYSIYYERNQIMQDYMIQHQDTPRAETEVNDKVIRDYKQRMDERRNAAGRRRSTVGILSGLCSALAVTVLAGGVAMFSNYQKMHQMESVIASVMPGGDSKKGLPALRENETKAAENSSGKGWAPVDEPDYVIEEAAGGVYPTTAPSGGGKEPGAPSGDGKEQAAQVTPETMPAAESSAHETGAGQVKTDTQTPEPSVQTASKEEMTLPPTGGREETQAETAAKAQTETAPAKTQAETAAKTPAKTAAAKTPAKTAQAETASAINYSVYTVGDGETLYGICFKLYHNVKHIDEICRVNALPDEDSIYAGQKLLVP